MLIKVIRKGNMWYSYTRHGKLLGHLSGMVGNQIVKLVGITYVLF